jgi:hypothetical protein
MKFKLHSSIFAWFAFLAVLQPINSFSRSTGKLRPSSALNSDPDEPLDENVSLEAFQARKQQQEHQEDEEVFDGYAMRDVLHEKWGKCYDVEFNRVESFGFPQLYLNIMPFHLGGRRFRHETELDYLCHLQAVVEILDKYEQVRSYRHLEFWETMKTESCTHTSLDWLFSCPNRRNKEETAGWDFATCGGPDSP